MQRNLYEIFQEFETKTTKEERIAVLRNNDSTVLRSTLRCAFHPDIKFFLERIPYYTIPPTKPGMSDYKMHNIISKLYLFQTNNPNYPALTYKKREQILIQFLEGMEHREGVVLMNVLFKDLKVNYLTPKLIKEVWPPLLP